MHITHGYPCPGLPPPHCKSIGCLVHHRHLLSSGFMYCYRLHPLSHTQSFVCPAYTALRHRHTSCRELCLMSVRRPTSTEGLHTAHDTDQSDSPSESSIHPLSGIGCTHPVLSHPSSITTLILLSPDAVDSVPVISSHRYCPPHLVIIPIIVPYDFNNIHTTHRFLCSKLIVSGSGKCWCYPPT